MCCKVSRSKSLRPPVPRLHCLCTESSVKRQCVLNTNHLGPPKWNSPPFVFRDSICQIRNACYIKKIPSMVGLFWQHMILIDWDIRGPQHELPTHNRTIPFRKANFAIASSYFICAHKTFPILLAFSCRVIT